LAALPEPGSADEQLLLNIVVRSDENLLTHCIVSSRRLRRDARARNVLVVLALWVLPAVGIEWLRLMEQGVLSE